MLACALWFLLAFNAWKEGVELLTDWDLFTEMIPVTPDVSLHHLPTQHVTLITTVTFQESLFLSSHRSVVCLVEPFFDQINNCLALLLGQNRFWKASIKQARDSHRMMRLLMVGWEESTKIHVISKVRCVVLGVRIRIAREVSMTVHI